MAEIRERIVLKYGSRTVTNEYGMDEIKIGSYAEKIAALKEKYDIVVVSSGAIAVGRALAAQVGNKNSSDLTSDEDLQSLATLGSAQAVMTWQTAFACRGILAGQILVTHKEIDDTEQEGGMLRKVTRNNLEHGWISIFNENDALSNTEVAMLSYGGDNDGLARHVAYMTLPKHLCLLTDVEGLYDQNNQLITHVEPQQFERAKNLARPREGGKTQGMFSKVNAAIKATEYGTISHIAHADAELTEVIEGRRGTHFHPAIV